MNISFAETGWEDYIYWQTQDKKTLKRINVIIQNILREPFSGIGKPEPLKDNLLGYWSRRIDDYNRIIYTVDVDIITITQCRGHY